MSRRSEDRDGPDVAALDETSRLDPRGRLDVVVVALCALAAALALLAGIVAVAASDTSVQGTVEGGGWGGRGCYPSVSYSVDGRDYVLHAEKDTRWCGLHLPGPARVYYDPDEPAHARLARYGDAPGRLLALALVVLLVAGFVSTRQRSGEAAAVRAGRPGVLRGRRGRVPRIVVAALLVGWLVVSIVVVVNGERRSSLDGLHAAIAHGEVSRVDERGALVGGTRGASAVRLSWREGAMRSFAVVRQYRGDRFARRAPQGARDVVVGDLAEQLGRGGVDVEVRPDLRSTGPSFVRFTPWGWHVVGWPVYLVLALLVMTVRVLVVAEPPRRATRWAWFWLIVIAPLPFAPAFLAWGGPLGGRPRTPTDVGRLSGLVAFLVAVGLAALQGSMT